MTSTLSTTATGWSGASRTNPAEFPIVDREIQAAVSLARDNRNGGTKRSIEAAEASCRRSESLLRTIIDSSKAVVYLKDPQGRYELVNRQWADLFGATQDSVVGKTDHDIFPTEIADAFRTADLQIMANGQAVELEELAPHSDGLHTYLSVKVPVVGPDGVPYALCGISTDITERKRMEEELRMREKQLRGAFQAAAIGMGLTTPEGRWQQVNPALSEIVGYSEQELLSLTIQDLTHPDDRHSKCQMMGMSLAGEISSFQTEKRFQHRSGKLVWVRLSMSVICNEAGRPVQFVVQIEDITPRKQAEELAGSLYADLQDAYEATIAGWARALDLRDHETEGHSQRVTEVTIRLARDFGVSEAELVHIRRGAPLHDIGKMGVPDAILLKPGALTEDEWPIMRRHPDLAAEMLEPIEFLRPALSIPHCHHEKWDGSGYPRGLIGEEIPLAARIFAVVDIWDALTHDRPYRSAWPEDRVRSHLRSIAGTHLDPIVVAAFLDRPFAEWSGTPDLDRESVSERPSGAPNSRPRTTVQNVNPVFDSARLASLRMTGLMDSPADDPFDRLVQLTSKILRAPVCMVSLVDDRRQFFKSSCGLPEPWASLRETPLSHSFCKEVVRAGASLIVSDARLDPRVCDNHAVSALGVIAYAGIPIRTTDGYVLGSFCVVDVNPRIWTEEDIEMLATMAAAVMTEIELRSDVAARHKVEEELRRSQGRVAEQLCIANDLNLAMKGRGW